MNKRLLIDCDPGQDDAIALLFAFGSHELDILGITTVAGNVPLGYSTGNALKICELAGRSHIPVHAGCEKPLLQRLHTAEHVHGKTGLDGVKLSEPRMKIGAAHAVDFIIDTVMSHPEGALNLCVTGPMTNVAVALAKEPKIAQRLKEIICMGGAMIHGNITPSAEFNFFVDPTAAEIVFRSGIPLTMLGLDVTHQALTTPQRIDRIRCLGTPVADAAADILTCFSSTGVDEQFGLTGGPVHDACVIAYLLKPDLFEGKACYVEIDTEKTSSPGRSIVDWWGVSGQKPNATVVHKINAEGFFELLTSKIANL